MTAFASRFPLRWVCYLAYFVGVSFQSGGIVHYSIDPGRYGKLIVIGAIVFIFGAIASDLTDKESILRSAGPIGFATFIVSSLILSIGVGMIGGAVQHFLDIPTRAPYLIGFGLILSALGFHGRFRPHNHATEMVASIVVVGLLALPVVAVLRSYATRLPEARAQHGGHGDEPTAEATTPPNNSEPATPVVTSNDFGATHTPAPVKRVTPPGDPETTTTTLAAENGHTDDGHTDDGH